MTEQADPARLWAQASHDLRQPVQAMLLLLPMLDAGDGRLRKDVSAWLGSSLNALHAMLEAITLLARIEVGERAPETGAVDISALCAKRAAKIATEVGREITCRGGAATIASDAQLLAQIVDGMMLAALKAGSSPVRVDVRSGPTVSVAIVFRGRAPTAKQWAGTFEEVKRGGVEGHPVFGMGLGFALRMAGALGATLACEEGSGNEQRLVLTLQRTAA